MNLTKLKISNRDKKLFLFVIALLVLFVTYRFIYYPNIQSCKSLKEETETLRTRETELVLINEKLEETQEENIYIKQKITDLINSFGSGAAFEKTILFLKDLEEVADMKISVIGFNDPEYIYTANQLQSVPVPEEGAVEDGSVQSEGEAVPASPDIGMDSLCGYNSSVTIEFKVSYEGLKKCIDYINLSSERKNIENMKVVYDLGTGNLSGSMSINMYHLTDADSSEEIPAVAGVAIGTDNIFGTIELPES